MPPHENFETNESSLESSRPPVHDGNRSQESQPKTHSLVKAAFGGRIYMNPEELLVEEQAKQLIKKKFQQAVLKVVKARDPRIKQILYLRDFEEQSFEEIGEGLFAEWPIERAGRFAKNRYYYYQRRIEKFMAKDGQLKELFKAMR